MKNWKCKLCLPLLLLGLLVSCGKKELVIEDSMESIAVVRTNISTRALNDSNVLGTAETLIYRVRVYAFDGDRLDKMVYQEYDDTEAASEVSVEVKVRQASTKMIYVIVNEPDTEPMRVLLSSINTPAALGGVEYQMADYFTNLQGSIFNSAANFDTGFCLPMFGVTQSEISTVLSQATPFEVEIPVIRSLARVDVYVQKDESISQELAIDNTTLFDVTNTRGKGYLTNSSVPSGSLLSVAGMASGLQTRLTIPTRISNSNSAAVRAFTFYTPERKCATQGERIAFAFKSLNYGSRHIDYSPVIIGNKSGEELIKIERNKVHRVYCTFQPKFVDVEITVVDWNDKNIVGDIVGAELTVSQSKVVLDWWNLGQKFDTSVDYASDGDVSFVGYVIKSDDGTDLSVTTDGSNLPTWLPKANITGLPNSTTKSGTIGLKYDIVATTQYEVVLRIKTGNITKDITVIYDNGYLPNSVLSSPGLWITNLPSKGIHLAKRGNVLTTATASEQDPTHVWSTILTKVDGTSQQHGTGALNTTQIVKVLGVNASVAHVCSAMGSGWYLSSKAEMITIKDVRQYLGMSYLMISTGSLDYWTSSQSITADQGSYAVNFINNMAPSCNKIDPYRVRCVRNL